MNQIGKIFHLRSGLEKDYTLRNLEISDVPVILELQDRVMTGGFDPRWFYPFGEQELMELVESDNIAIGVYIEEKLIAFRAGCFSGREFEEIISVLGEKYKERPCFLMNGVFVDKAYRGNHLQRKLSEYCMELCRGKGIQTFFSVVHPHNIPSVQSIKSMGFEERKRQMLFDGNYERFIFVKERN